MSAPPPAGPMPEHPMPPRHAPSDTSVNTLLLDIVQQMGRIEGTQNVMARQLQEATESRGKLHQKLDLVSDRATAAAHRAEIAVTHAEQAANVAANAVTAASALKPSVDDYVQMKGYFKIGVSVIGLIVMPLIGLLGYGAVQLWHTIMANVDFSKMWKS